MSKVESGRAISFSFLIAACLSLSEASHAQDRTASAFDRDYCCEVRETGNPLGASERHKSQCGIWLLGYGQAKSHGSSSSVCSSLTPIGWNPTRPVGPGNSGGSIGYKQSFPTETYRSILENIQSSLPEGEILILSTEELNLKDTFETNTLTGMRVYDGLQKDLLLGVGRDNPDLLSGVEANSENLTLIFSLSENGGLVAQNLLGTQSIRGKRVTSSLDLKNLEASIRLRAGIPVIPDSELQRLEQINNLQIEEIGN